VNAGALGINRRRNGADCGGPPAASPIQGHPPGNGSRALASEAGSADLELMTANPAFDYRRLSIAERLLLVADIWDSIAADADAESLPLSEADKALLDERLAEQNANPGTGAPWTEVRARIVDRSP